MRHRRAPTGGFASDNGPWDSNGIARAVGIARRHRLANFRTHRPTDGPTRVHRSSNPSTNRICSPTDRYRAHR